VKELRCGFELINLKNNKKAVVTIPMQLSNTTNILIELANENKGCLFFSMCQKKLNMSENVFITTIVNIII
jgi:hypothetical protein